MFGYLKTRVFNRLTGSSIIDQVIVRYIVTYTFKNLKYINDPWTFENTNRFVVVCLFILSHVNNIIRTNRTLVTIAIWSSSVSPLYYVSIMSICQWVCNYILFYFALCKLLTWLLFALRFICFVNYRKPDDMSSVHRSESMRSRIKLCDYVMLICCVNVRFAVEEKKKRFPFK